MKSTLTKFSFLTLILLFLSNATVAQNPRRAKATIKTTAECIFCKQSIEKTLSKVKGIRKVECDYVKHEVYVMYNSKKIALNDIRKTLNDMGYDADDMPANNVKSGQIKHGK